MTLGWRPRGWSLMLLVALVAGCADEPDDVRQWIEEQRKVAVLKLEPVKPPVVFQPEPFVGGAATSPFSDEKLVRALRSDATVSAVSRLLQSEQQRPREELEAHPLDAFAMVGTLEQGGRRVALVKVGGVLHQVRVGNYIGQHFGRVIAIGESHMTVREIVQDASGEWVERIETLNLVEGSSP